MIFRWIMKKFLPVKNGVEMDKVKPEDGYTKTKLKKDFL